jgi:hypothetical protein
MDKQSICFSDLPITVDPGADDADNPFEAETEFRLLEEAKDILDELQMIRDVNKQQTSVLKLLADNSFGTEPTRRRRRFVSGPDPMQKTRIKFFLDEKPRARAETVGDLWEKAKAAYEAVIHLLDLKQKQANIYEARSATKMVRESEKSGETIMLVSFPFLGRLALGLLC